MNGYVSREPLGIWHFIITKPFVCLLYNIQGTKQGDAALNTTSLDPSVLSRYNTRYVICTRENLTQQQIDLSIRYLGRRRKERPLFMKKALWLCTPCTNRYALPFKHACLIIPAFRQVHPGQTNRGDI